MAGQDDDTERSEDPTQKRLDEALERGDVVKSQEVNTWFIISAATLILMSFSGAMGGALTTTMRGLIANSYAIRVDGRGFPEMVSKIGLEVIGAVAIPLLLLFLAAAAGNLIQHRLVWSTEALSPKLSKISPLAGLGRLFSKQGLANFIKGLLKLVVIGSIMTVLLWPQRDRLEGLVTVDVAAVLPITQSLSSTCSAPSSPCSRSSPPPTICSSTANGTSGRKCRCTRSSRSSSRPTAIR